MNVPTRLMFALMLCGPFVVSQPGEVSAQSGPGVSAPDGQRDFDWEIGSWHTQLSRLMNPLSDSAAWVEYEGTSVVRKVWEGRANLVELDVEGPAGRLEVLSLRLYNPQSRQWSLNSANSSFGTLGQPMIGGFRDGRGEFFGQTTVGGRTVFVRFIITSVDPDTWRFEQAFSADGGESWEVNWIAIDTKIPDGGGHPSPDAR